MKRPVLPDAQGSEHEVATSGRWRGAPPLRAEAQFMRRAAGDGSMAQVAVARGRQESASLQFGTERLLRCHPTGSCRPRADIRCPGLPALKLPVGHLRTAIHRTGKTEDPLAAAAAPDTAPITRAALTGGSQGGTAPPVG